VVVVFSLLIEAHPSKASSAQELATAAIRLKQAHVLRSYEKCMKKVGSDTTCRAEIEALHPREIQALSKLSNLSTAIDEYELSAALANCYNPKNDYSDLIECWETTAETLAASNSIRSEKPRFEELEYHILEQLRCFNSPEPVFTFLALERLGKINGSEMIGFDSVSCFRIHGGIEISGLLFNSVCGHSEDSLVQELFPDLVWRGPGTSPGQFISFGTSANFKTTSEWYVKNFTRKRLNQAIETDNTSIGDPTEVTCSSWMH